MVVNRSKMPQQVTKAPGKKKFKNYRDVRPILEPKTKKIQPATAAIFTKVPWYRYVVPQFWFCSWKKQNYFIRPKQNTI